jgi:hypothetical protein
VAKKSVSGVGAVCIEMLDVVARDELMPHEDGGGTGLRPGRSSEGRIRPSLHEVFHIDARRQPVE